MHIACPDRNVLAAWSMGFVDESGREQIALHVSSCDSCLSTLDSLELPSDPMLEQLRSPEARGSTSEVSGNRPNEARRYSQRNTLRSPEVIGAATELSPGSMVGPYEILEELRRGGMGAVYRARHNQLDRVVALKVLPPNRFRDPRAVTRFRREMKSAGAVDHPNVVRAGDAGESGGVHYIAMEYIDGLDLDRLIQQRGSLRVVTACKIIRKVALALEHVHKKGMVHRDVKPSNIMISRDGRVRLLDLGLALLRGNGADVTESGVVLGTAAYMAPEQAFDPHGVDIRADLYGLGCTLFFLLAGRPPFGGQADPSPLKTLMAHAQEPTPSIQAIRPEIPDPLAAALKRLMAKNPAERFQTPAEVAASLAPYCEESPNSSLSPEQETVVATPAGEASARRWPRWLAARTGITVLVLIVASLIALQIVIRFWDKDGKERRFKADAGETLRRAHDPMSRISLVQSPAEIRGVSSWTIETRHPRFSTSVAYDCKVRWLAVGSADGVVRLYDARSGLLVRILVGHDTSVLALAFHPSRPILASSSDRGVSTTRIWDVETGRLIRELPGFAEGTRCLAWSPDGANLAMGGFHGLRLWDINTGRGADLGPFSIFGGLAWSPDGTTLAFDSGTNGPYLFDIDKMVQRQFPTTFESISALAWSPDGRALAVTHGGANQGVAVADATTGKELARFEQPGGFGRALAFSPDGTAIATAEGVYLWDLKTRQERLPRPPQWFRHALGLAWSAHGKSLAVAQGVHTAVHDSQSGAVTMSFDTYHQSYPNSLASWSSDGSMLVWGGMTSIFETWDSSSYEPLGGLGLDNHRGSLSPDGRFVACVRKGILHIFDFQSKGEERRIATASTGDRPSAWSPDSRSVAVQGENSIELFNRQSGDVSRRIDFRSEDDLILSWSPDGKILAAAGTRQLQLFDVSTGQRRNLQDNNKQPAYRYSTIQWSPDGRRLACGYGADIQVWDPPAGRELFRRPAHAGSVLRIAWSTDGKTVFSGGLDDRGVKVVKTWDAATGNVLKTRQGVGLVPSPDGKRVADFEPCSIRLHNLETDQSEGVIVVLPAPRALAISPEGHYRASAGVVDEIVYVVKTENGQEMFAPAEFSARHGWKNDSSQVGIAK